MAKQRLRRRWVLRARTATGEETYLAIQVQNGVIGVSIGENSAIIQPTQGVRLREIWREAVTQALMDRGHW